MSNHWEPSRRHRRPAARPQRASWTQDHSGLSLVLTLVWERRCPRWRKTRQTICSLRTTTLGTDAPGANASPFTSVPLTSPVRAIPALATHPGSRLSAVACLAGLTAGGSYGLVEGLRTSQGERRRIRINSVLNAMGRRGPGLGNSLGCVGACQSSCLSRPACLTQSLVVEIRVPAAPIARLTDRGACACQP